MKEIKVLFNKENSGMLKFLNLIFLANTFVSLGIVIIMARAAKEDLQLSLGIVSFFLPLLIISGTSLVLINTKLLYLFKREINSIIRLFNTLVFTASTTNLIIYFAQILTYFVISHYNGKENYQFPTVHYLIYGVAGIVLLIIINKKKGE